jgi:hypothetical protein
MFLFQTYVKVRGFSFVMNNHTDLRDVINKTLMFPYPQSKKKTFSF